MTAFTNIVTLLYALLLCTTLALLWACDKESGDPLPADNEVLCVQATQMGYTEKDGKTRAVTDETLKTTFEAGDAIGVFAIVGGVVQPECKNLKLTLQADGTWGGNTVYFITNATYFAYSPYRDEAGINAATSVSDIYNNFTLNDSQSSPALFAANDLMTSTTCTASRESKTLTIAFEHRFALVEMDYAYCKTSSTGLTYRLKGAAASELHLMDGSGAIVIGYRPSPTGALKRFLLKPGTAHKLACVYEYPLQSGDYEYPTFDNGAKTFSFAAARRYKLVSYKTRDVKVLDYYYSDGSIYPKEWTDAGGVAPNINNGCIGVVFALGSTGIANGDNISYTSVHLNPLTLSFCILIYS